MAQPESGIHYGEPGLFMEIYLPKNAEFQPLLYDTLTAGFDLAKVRAHFCSKAKSIRRFMNRNQQLHTFSPDRISRFGNVFSGYSLYQVDGTFEGDAQERTQIVRVIFVPPVAQLPKGLKIPPDRRLFHASRFLRFWTHNLYDYERTAIRLCHLSPASALWCGSFSGGSTMWDFSLPAICFTRSARASSSYTGKDAFVSGRRSFGLHRSGTLRSTGC
jgi:hypothetical protein